MGAIATTLGGNRGVSRHTGCQSKTAQSEKLGPLLQPHP